MPNGHARQHNTAHANRQRSLQQVRASAVEVAPVVVEAMAMEEARAGEVKKLKKQIVGLKHKLTNTEKKMEKEKKRVDELEGGGALLHLGEAVTKAEMVIKHLEKDLSKEKKKFKIADKALKEIKKEVPKLLMKEVDANKNEREELGRMNKMFACLHNHVMGTSFDVHAEGEKMNKQLRGVSYDDLCQGFADILEQKRYYDLVMRRARSDEEKKASPDGVIHMLIGEELYAVKHVGNKKDLPKGSQSIGIAVCAGTEDKDYEEISKRIKEHEKKSGKGVKQWVVPGGCWDNDY